MTALASYLLRVGQPGDVRDRGFEWMQRAAGTGHREGKYLFAALLASWPDAARRDPARVLTLMGEVGRYFDYDPLSFEIRAAALAAQGDFKAARRAQSRAHTMARELDWDTSLHRARLDAYKQDRVLPGELIEF